MTTPRTVRLALVQASSQETPEVALREAIAAIREAASAGARIICLQELFNQPYFCRTQDTALFDLAETVPGPTTVALQPVARELGVVLIVPVFERAAPGVYFNTAAVIDADGACLGKYRKMHIPQDPGFEEKFYFTPGDLGYRVFRTRYAVIGVLICWDQWYPEAARLTALRGAEILFYPTAIGWLDAEKPTLGEAQHNAWETVQRGHAVANGCYVAAPNRVGREGGADGITFWGQSFVSDFYGQVIAKAPEDKEAIVLADCDLDALEAFRRIWPFFRDRRVDSYGDIGKRLIEEPPGQVPG